jgi:hypothetical protein
VTTRPDGFEFVEAGKITVKGAIGSNIDHVLKTMTEFCLRAYEVINKYEARRATERVYRHLRRPGHVDLIRQDMMMAAARINCSTTCATGRCTPRPRTSS